MAGKRSTNEYIILLILYGTKRNPNKKQLTFMDESDVLLKCVNLSKLFATNFAIVRLII